VPCQTLKKIWSDVLAFLSDRCILGAEHLTLGRSSARFFIQGGTMSEVPNKPRDEKEEKHRDEKDEKQHEKEEKGRSDPLSNMAWGAVVIWAGLVLLADNMGYLTALNNRDIPGPMPFGFSTWGLIFLGAGVILIIEVGIRVLNPSYRRHVMGTLILAIVFLGIGLGNLVNWGVLWALALIGVGVVILLRAMGWKI